MKKITIGRSRDCNIRLDDQSDRVSRKHAVITVSPTGKMLIYDLSQNGTYVNGIKVEKPNGYPVKKGDRVCFADTADLDWSKFKDPYRNAKIGIGAFLCVAVIAAISIPVAINASHNHTLEAASTTVSTDSIPSIADDKPEKTFVTEYENPAAEPAVAAGPSTPNRTARRTESKKAKHSATDGSEDKHPTDTHKVPDGSIHEMQSNDEILNEK